MKRPLRGILVALVFAQLAGCAGLGGANLTPEERVSKRAQAWADALMEGDWRTAYTFTSPGYRQSATAGRYHAKVAGAYKWKSAEVREVTCTETSCKVKLILEYPAHKSDMDIRRPLTYTWVLSEGEWWLFVPG
ncbi:MAG: hypothetical protein R3228_12505 [Halioglobus sp.]|nr:hypothetical protein [Halioglobus sp.]